MKRDPAAERALVRLRSGPSVERLAQLIVDHAMTVPLTEVASPQWLAGQLCAAMEALSGDAAHAWVLERYAVERVRWASDDRPVRSVIPDEVDAPVRTLLGRPWTPDEDLTFRVLDQPAIRSVLRHLLTDGLKRFRSRVSSVDAAFGGLGKRAASRGRGLLGGLSGTVGAVAGDLVGAVREEVEGGLDGRVGDFAKQASAGQVRALARYVSDPKHAETFGELRISIWDVLLEATFSELVGELDKAGPEEAIAIVRESMRAMVSAPDSVERLRLRIERVMAEVGEGTLADWLKEVGLLEVWSDSTVELVGQHLERVVVTEAFEQWWHGLFDED